MKKFYVRYILVYFVFTFFTMAKVPILISSTMLNIISEDLDSLNLFVAVEKETEKKVLELFTNKQANFAIVRKDYLKAYAKKYKQKSYYILGKLKTKMDLYFMTNDDKIQSIKDLYHKKISVGLLRDSVNIYLKHILAEENLLYKMNIKSNHFLNALKAMKNNDLDAIFIFESDRVKKHFPEYIKPYPEGFLEVLKNESGLTCEKQNCSMVYYLIVSDGVGKQVMHNVYERISSIIVKKNKLMSNLGQYYIDIEQKKYSNIIKNIQQNKFKTTDFKFRRTPWMDIAIKEAIKGKGSAENVFPMLDLSYKYIRFSKGDKGITTAPNDNKLGSWCAAYICWTLNKAGYKVHSKGRMASQSFRYFNHKLYRKIKKPIFGAITLYTSSINPLHGHVGYLFGHTKNGKNILLGGNQNNRLKFASYAMKGFGSYLFNGFYVPIDYKIKKIDYLTEKDIYISANILNRYYGLKKSKDTRKVR